MELKVTFLGTGTSCGVPTIGCGCKVCRSVDHRDRRLRCAALLETDGTRVLIDCGPDIRQQLLKQPFKKIDGVLLTHLHYDHIGGLDDLRPFCMFGDVNIYADARTEKRVQQAMPYCFGEHLYPGVPKLCLHCIKPHQSFRIGDIPISAIEVMHDKMPILGYRFGRFAYITDMKTIEESELPYLEGVEILVVNALRFVKEHHSHQLVEDAIRFARRLKAKHTYLIHESHEIGLHAEASKKLPSDVELAFDGEVISVDAF